ncbi:MAG TPA: peptide deformylase [bacterium]|nr:peptide deformylase [bacterium]HPT30142.1 peptide deformylase [bacterium]
MYKPKVLDIIHHPDSRLRQKSAELQLAQIKDDKFRRLVLDMVLTMLQKDGAGLAAPQIGQNIRLVVVRKDYEKNDVLIMINPKITKKSWAKCVEEEGCLSVVDAKGDIIYGLVERPKKVACVFLDLAGNKQRIEATELLARAIQHEVDHLDGILFIDHLYEKKKKN